MMVQNIQIKKYTHIDYIILYYGFLRFYENYLVLKNKKKNFKSPGFSRRFLYRFWNKIGFLF